MSVHPVVVPGRITPEGTLELSQPVNLPPGEVQVTIAPAEEPGQAKKGLVEWIEDLRAQQRARGHVARSAEEIDAEIQSTRDEAEEEIQEIERTQWESARVRRQGGRGALGQG